MKPGDKVVYIGPRLEWLKPPLEPGTVGRVKSIADGLRPCPAFDDGRWGKNAVGVFVSERDLAPVQAK